MEIKTMPCIFMPNNGMILNLQEKAFKDEKLLRRFLKTFKEAREKSELTGEQTMSEIILENSLNDLLAKRSSEKSRKTKSR